MILLDAGPMIAILHRDDSHHSAGVEVLRELSEPMLTVWPAVTEAMYLLVFSTDAEQRLWELLASDAVAIVELARIDFRECGSS